MLLKQVRRNWLTLVFVPAVVEASRADDESRGVDGAQVQEEADHNGNWAGDYHHVNFDRIEIHKIKTLCFVVH